MAENEKTTAELLAEKLCVKSVHSGQLLSDEEQKAADDFCEDYKRFLSSCKTERECADYFESLAKKNGFVEFDKNKKYNTGDRVFRANRGKAIMFAVFGKKSISEGVRIVAAHIDSPRIDLKPNPVYEDSELAYFKTHYYGGIKKYQWTAIPLAMHGVVILGDGTKINITLGEGDDEPKFVITDLLPHLAKEQMKKPLADAIEGEELNILIGSRPFKSDKGSELVKLNILNILNEKYGIIEADFRSAELEFVPAYKAWDIGFDRSMIGSYGQDDRVCAYPSFMAALDCGVPEYTSITVLTDKEETGSDGNTGLKSAYLQYFIEDLSALEGFDGRDVLTRSECLSADVNAGFDPTFPTVLEKMNAAYLNKGICVTKYTGARGKSGTSDASAEFVGKIRKIFDDKKIIWQMGELGKVDEGGGGTVAMYIANLNVDVVDVGVPVLSMHSPFEVVAKFDVYMAFKAFKAFFCAE